MNILEQADQIVNKRAEEKARQYGDFSTSMEIMRDIFNAMTGHDLTAIDMYYAMIAMKLARERHAHKRDNLLDLCAYVGALDNYFNENESRYTSTIEDLEKAKEMLKFK